MAVILKNMKMPKQREGCPFYANNNIADTSCNCWIHYLQGRIAKECFSTHYMDCPLAEIPAQYDKVVYEIMNR